VADYDEVIPPGSEGKIGVKLIGHKLHPGRFTKSFTVTTNDPENAKVTLSVTGQVRQVFQVSKAMALSGYRGDELKDEVILTTSIEEPVNLTGFHWSDQSKDKEALEEGIGVKITAIEKGKKYKIDTWLKKDLPPKQYLADIYFETDFEQLPEKKLQFRLQIMEDVELHPSTVYMRELEMTEGTSKSFEKIVSVISARGDSLKILDVIPSDESITWNIREVKPGKAYTCKFQIRPKSEPGKYEATLKFLTNYPGYEELVVPIKGSVRITKDLSK
jgi:hypothetical protein